MCLMVVDTSQEQVHTPVAHEDHAGLRFLCCIATRMAMEIVMGSEAIQFLLLRVVEFHHFFHIPIVRFVRLLHRSIAIEVIYYRLLYLRQ